MIQVTAQKLRHLGRNSVGAVVGRVYSGELAGWPRIGERLVICRADGDQMVTTPIRRMLIDPSGLVAYLQTQNSSYRLTLSQPVAPAHLARRPKLRVQLSDDGSEFTLLEESTPEGRSGLASNTALQPDLKEPG